MQIVIASIIALWSLLAIPALAQTGAPPIREITKIAGEVYRFRNNSIVMNFPKERILYAVDFIPVMAIAFRDFPDAYLPDWLDSLKRVEATDFDILAPGRGPLGNKDSVRDFRVYLDELYATVLKQAREGKKVDEVKAAPKMPKYEARAGYKETFDLNVEGVYRLVQGQRRPN